MLKIDKERIKQNAKKLWNDHKGEVKVGLTCLAVGGTYGFIKGMQAENILVGNALVNLIDKIPTIPEPDDLPIEEIVARYPKEYILSMYDD